MKAKERLLRAAIHVFSEKGFTGASTREIARRARVNPVTLFRTFNSKEQLHVAVVEHLIAGLQVRKQIDQLAQRGVRAHEFIAGIIKVVVDANLTTPQFQRVIWNAALERREIVSAKVLEHLLPILKRVQLHLSEYMEKGQLRKSDPLVAARLILGVAIYHYQLYELFGAKKVADFSRADLSKAYADMLYAGLKP